MKRIVDNQRRFFISHLSSLIFLVFHLSSLIPHPSSFVYAEVPRLINYQGRLTDKQGKPLEGTHSITFRIYDKDGIPKWEETHSGTVVQKGIFSVMLGSVKNLDLAFDEKYYLQIMVNGEVMKDAQGNDKQLIAAAGYAIRAERLVDEPLPTARGGTGTIANANTANGVVVLDGNSKLPAVNGALLTGISGNFKVGSFTKDLATASGRQPITGLGFQPKAVLFSMVNDSRSAGSTNGFDDGTTATCVWWDFNSIDNMWFISTSAL